MKASLGWKLASNSRGLSLARQESYNLSVIARRPCEKMADLVGDSPGGDTDTSGDVEAGVGNLYQLAHILGKIRLHLRPRSPGQRRRQCRAR